jgi:hypothetical protein
MTRRQPWFDHVSRRAGARRGAPALRSRALRFEQCESRLALSTTMAAAASNGDVDGGAILLDVAQRYSLATPTTVQTASAFDRTSIGDFGTLNIVTSPGGNAPQVVNRLSLELSTITPQPTGGLWMSDSVTGRDADPFGAFDDYDSPANPSLPGLFDSDTTVAESPIRPIAPPMVEAPAADGGLIALDVFMRAERFRDLGATSTGAVAGSRVGDAHDADERLTPTPAADTWRGRAVVFEVAYHQAAGGGVDDARSIAADAADELFAASEAALPVESTRSGRAGQTPHAEAASIAAENAADRQRPASESQLPSGENPLSIDDRISAAELLSALPKDDATADDDAARAAHDDALAEWPGDDDSDGELAAAPTDAGTSHRTMIGAALALVAGTAPFSRRFRGLLAKSVMEQRPPRRRR